MEKIIERIDELLKKKSKIGNANSLEAAELIYKLYCSNKDCEVLVNYLYDFYYKVSGIFASKYYFEISKEERDQIIESFLNNKRFNDVITTSLSRGFSILTEIIGKDVTETNDLLIINSLAKIAKKNNEFNATSCDIFLKFLNASNDKFFDLDFSSLLDNEINGVYRYINATIPDINIIPYSNKILGWVEKNFTDLPKQTFTSNDKNIEVNSSPDKIEEIIKAPKVISPSVNIAKSAEIDNAKELINIIQSANQQLEKLFDNIFSKNNTIQNLQEKLNAKEKEMNSFKIEIENKNTNLMSLNGEINKVKTELSNKEIKIDDLTERLKTSFNADDISKKQELLTLKNDIATAVKLQYEDFNEHKNESCTEDNYQALKVNLNQVFRTLKKYGIEL